MKSFLKIKSIDNGMVLLLDDFCKKNGIMYQKNNQYTLNEHVQFGEWLNRIKEINEQYQKDGIGLDIGALVKPNHKGILAYIAQFSHTLRDYLNIISKYEKLWFNYIPKKVEFDEQFFSITWDKPTYLKLGLYLEETAITEEIQVSLIHHHFQRLLGLNTAIFSHLELTSKKPNDLEKYFLRFKCPIIFNAKQTKIVLPNSLLETKLNQYDPILLEILLDYADMLLNKMPKLDSFIELINLSIMQAIENNNVQIDAIAKSLNTTPRMLQKELKTKGLSYRIILNNIRQELAKKYLKNPKIPITEIAFLLAYKDQTSFNRSFKTTNGISPSMWRKKNIN